MQVVHRNFQIEDIFFLSFQGVSFQNNLSKNLHSFQQFKSKTHGSQIKITTGKT